MFELEGGINGDNRWKNKGAVLLCLGVREVNLSPKSHHSSDPTVYRRLGNANENEASMWLEY